MNANEVDVIFFQAKIQKFDNNFFNFEDPEVYRKFTNPNETDIWKKTYGYDFACTSAVLRCVVEGHKKCVKESKSSFAKNCRKDNGFFKCCQISLMLKVFHNTRQKLYSAGLIKKDPADDVTATNEGAVMAMTFLCTYRDHNDNLKHRYKSPSINPIGGIVIEPQKTKSRIEFRAINCASTNLCMVRLKLFIPQFGIEKKGF